MQIDELRLNVGRVIYKDYARGDKPVILAYEGVLKDKVFKDIKSPQQLATLVMVQAMGPAAIKGAKIYAAASLLGAAFLPAGVVGALIGKDSSTAEYDRNFERVYQAGLSVLKDRGELKTDDRDKGVIKAIVDGCDVALALEKISEQKTMAVISARKLMLPKPEVAAGIQYQIEQEL